MVQIFKEPVPVILFHKICFKVKVQNVQNFQWLSHKNKSISQTEGYFENT